MVRIIILLDRQTISRIDKNVLVSDSKDYTEMQVIGSDQKLSDLKIDRLQAIFWNADGSTIYSDVDLLTGECEVPSDAITKDGFKISLYGTKVIKSDNSDMEDPDQPVEEFLQTVLTTNRISVDVRSSGFDSPDDYPDAYSRILCRLDKVDKEIEKINNKLDTFHPVVPPAEEPSDPVTPPSTGTVSAYVIKSGR